MLKGADITAELNQIIKTLSTMDGVSNVGVFSNNEHNQNYKIKLEFSKIIKDERLIISLDIRQSNRKVTIEDSCIWTKLNLTKDCVLECP